MDPEQVVCALVELARAAFSDEDGVVRVQASRDGDGALHLTAVPRWLGTSPARWRVCTAAFPHPGPMPWGGAKVSSHLPFVLAGRTAEKRGLDDAILFDRDGYLVEGSRTNLIVVGEDGLPATPDLARGGVAGIAREVLLERVPELRIRNISSVEVARAQELIAINAVRGARACIELDDAPVCDGEPGRWAKHFDACLRAES